MQDRTVNYVDFIFLNPEQIPLNIFKKLGSILYNFVTFWDCFDRMDGQCAGTRLGRVFYYPLDFRDIFDESKLQETYD